MDMNTFYDLLTNNEFIRDIPLTYVLRTAIVVFEIINSGDCYYEEETMYK